MRVVGWIFVAIFGVGGIAALTLGMSGGKSDTRFECDRGAGGCHAYFPKATYDVALGDVVDVDLGEAKEGLGRGGHVETQHAIVLRLKNGERAITPYTADTESVASFRAAIPTIKTFLSGSDPKLALAFHSRSSAASTTNTMMGSVLCLVLASALGGLLLFRTKGD